MTSTLRDPDPTIGRYPHLVIAYALAHKLSIPEAAAQIRDYAETRDPEQGMDVWIATMEGNRRTARTLRRQHPRHWTIRDIPQHRAAYLRARGAHR